MALVEDYDVVAALAANRADHAFNEAFCQGERGAVTTSVIPIFQNAPTAESAGNSGDDGTHMLKHASETTATLPKTLIWNDRVKSQELFRPLLTS